MSKNQLQIILLSSFSVGLVFLDIFGLIWYINAKSLVNEFLYLFVVLSLIYGNVTEKREKIFHNGRSNWFYKLLLAGNLSLAICNIIDAARATYIKWSYKFDVCYDCSDKVNELHLDKQYGEIERLIYSNCTLASMHYGVWLWISVAFFYILIKKIGRAIEEG